MLFCILCLENIYPSFQKQSRATSLVRSSLISSRLFVNPSSTGTSYASVSLSVFISIFASASAGLSRTGTTAHSPLQCPQHPAQYLALVKCSKKVNRSNAYGRDTQTMFPDAQEFHRDISEGTTRLMRELNGWSSESQNKVL